MTSSRDKLWRAVLSFRSGPVEKAGYMVKPMRLNPTNKVGQAFERAGLQRLPREACYDQERGQSGQSGERHSDTQ